VRSLERNVLGFVGIGPIHETPVGAVDGVDHSVRSKSPALLRTLGARAA
jgi:hypothetical protein